jgi:hypothetical protein
MFLPTARERSPAVRGVSDQFFVSFPSSIHIRQVSAAHTSPERLSRSRRIPPHPSPLCPPCPSLLHPPFSSPLHPNASSRYTSAWTSRTSTECHLVVQSSAPSNAARESRGSQVVARSQWVGLLHQHASPYTSTLQSPLWQKNLRLPQPCTRAAVRLSCNASPRQDI